MFPKGISLCCFQTKREYENTLPQFLLDYTNMVCYRHSDVTFSKEFGAKMNIQGNNRPRQKCVMFAYAAISVGDLLVGFVSRWFKSRKKKALYVFYAITGISIFWFFNLHGASVSQLVFGWRLNGFRHRVLGNVCYHGC